jgi:AraC-like DNA-binding protein
MEYAHFLKLEEARKILDKHHELSIEAIAEECGLSTRTFYRLFKEHYKMSPAEYRKIAKKN